MVDRGGDPEGPEPHDGFHYPESPQVRRSWQRRPSEPHQHADDPESRFAPDPAGGDGGESERAEPAAERFRRSTRARVKHIPDLPRRGYWGLTIGTVLFVMIIGSVGDYTEPSTRLGGHALFWTLVWLGALVVVRRERRNGWEPVARWPWPAAAVVGSMLAEALALGVSSAVVVTVSVPLLGLGLFVLLLAS